MKSFCANSSISMHFASVRPTWSCESRNLESFRKRSWITWKPLFDTTLSCIMGDELLLLCFSFTMTIAMRSPLVWWHSSGLRGRPIAIGGDVGWIHFLSRDVHKCSKPFLDSIKKRHSEHCTLGIVSHNSNNSTLPMSRIIFFDFSLNGL